MTSRDSKPVRQCCCYPSSFTEIQQQAQAHHWQTVEEIGEALSCGTGCGMCRPYLARMLRTGETAFAVMEEPTEESSGLPEGQKSPVTMQVGKRQNRQ